MENTNNETLITMYSKLFNELTDSANRNWRNVYKWRKVKHKRIRDFLRILFCRDLFFTLSMVSFAKMKVCAIYLKIRNTECLYHNYSLFTIN